MTNDDIRRGQQVLAHLMRINTALGRMVPRWHDYEAEHGHLPASELRTRRRGARVRRAARPVGDSDHQRKGRLMADKSGAESRIDQAEEGGNWPIEESKATDDPGMVARGQT